MDRYIFPAVFEPGEKKGDGFPSDTMRIEGRLLSVVAVEYVAASFKLLHRKSRLSQGSPL